MSTAAATIPGKRDDFMKHRATKRVKPKPVNTDHTVKPKGKLGPVRNKPVKTTYFIEENHTSPEEEESWINRTENAIKSQHGTLADKTSSNSSLTLGASATNNSIHLNGGKPNVKIMPIPEYEAMKQDREHLRTLNAQLMTRVTELEGECGRLLGEFDAMYKENEQLRKKMDTGKQPLVEPYSRVFEDRNILREAEIGYKKRISKLQEEIKESREDNEKLGKILKTLKAKVVKANEVRETQNKFAKLQKENKGLHDTIEKLKNDLKQKDTQKNEIDVKVHVPYSKAEKSAPMLEKPSPIYKKADVKVQRKEIYNKANITPRKERFDYEYYLPDSDIYER